MTRLDKLLIDVPHTMSFPVGWTKEKVCSISINRIEIDSRKVQPGDLFVAIAGQAMDGHAFVSQAIQQGAAAVVVESNRLKTVPSVPCIEVSSTKHALAYMSAAFFDHPAKHMLLCAITGTNGKTTTTFLLQSILEEAGYPTGILGTIVYKYPGYQEPAPLTTPDALGFHQWLKKMYDHGTKAVAVEASSHALALGRLEGVFFDVAGFTNLSQDHLDFHRDMEDYFQAKKNLFEHHLKNRKNAVICVDNSYGKLLAQEQKDQGILTVSSKVNSALLGEKPDIYPLDLSLSLQGFSATFKTPKGTVALQCSLLGAHNVANVGVALGMALLLNIPLATIAVGISTLRLVPGRLERVVSDVLGPHVFIDYAHTPDALLQVLSTMRSFMPASPTSRLILIFGCGGDRDRGKRPMMGSVASDQADVVVVTSDNPRSENPAEIINHIVSGINSPPMTANGNRGYWVESDRKKAIHAAITFAQPNDVVLIVGKGHENQQLIGKEKFPFDDKQEALLALQSRSKE